MLSCIFICCIVYLFAFPSYIPRCCYEPLYMYSSLSWNMIIKEITQYLFLSGGFWFLELPVLLPNSYHLGLSPSFLLKPPWPRVTLRPVLRMISWSIWWPPWMLGSKLCPPNSQPSRRKPPSLNPLNMHLLHHQNTPLRYALIALGSTDPKLWIGSSP